MIVGLSPIIVVWSSFNEFDLLNTYCMHRTYICKVCIFEELTKKATKKLTKKLWTEMIRASKYVDK
jgi:hypothetical protein